MREIRWLRRHKDWVRRYGIYAIYVLVISFFLLASFTGLGVILATLYMPTALEPSSKSSPIVTLVVMLCYDFLMIAGIISSLLGLSRLKEKFQNPNFNFWGLTGSSSKNEAK